MSLHQVENELKLCYQGKMHSWDVLRRKICKISHEPSDFVILAQQCFTTVLYLLCGFINKKLVSPLSPDFTGSAESLSSLVSSLRLGATKQ